MINEYDAHMITSEKRDEIMSTTNALTEVFSAIYEQMIIVEIIALERDDALLYLVDVSTTDDHEYDIRAAFETHDNCALTFDTFDLVRELIMKLTATVEY